MASIYAPVLKYAFKASLGETPTRCDRAYARRLLRGSCVVKHGRYPNGDRWVVTANGIRVYVHR